MIPLMEGMEDVPRDPDADEGARELGRDRPDAKSGAGGP
jgi:hypothetical protein